MEAKLPKGPKGEKRPADAIGAAVKSMRILTGDETEETCEPVSLDTVDDAELERIQRRAKTRRDKR